MKKVVAVFLTVIFCFCLSSCGNETNEVETQNSSIVDKDYVYNTGVILSDNLDDFTFKLDNVVYRLPITLEDFTGNGWSFPEYFNDYEKPIDSEHKESAYLKKGENQISVELFNKSGNQKALKDCPIGRIEYDFSGDLQFYIAGDFLLNEKTFAEVKEKFGEPTSQDDYGVNINAVYEKTNSEWIYERYTFSFDSETKQITNISMVNFVKIEDVANDNSDIEYLSKYVAPNSLGNDLKSFNVSIMGNLYTLPAPVNEFTKNGWEIIESCDVGAGTYVDDGITMKKNGVTAKFGVYNFSTLQVDAKDATVFEVNTDEYDYKDIDLILPGNIKIGTTKEELEKALENSNDFSKEETETSTTYLLNGRERYIHIWLSEDDIVSSITVIHKECLYK